MTEAKEYFKKDLMDNYGYSESDALDEIAKNLDQIRRMESYKDHCLLEAVILLHRVYDQATLNSKVTPEVYNDIRDFLNKNS